MKILTANIAMGLRDMDRFGNNVLGLAAYHSWLALPGILIPALRGKGAGAPYSQKRIDYLRKHKDLDPLFRMIVATDPDILILNEVIPEVCGDELTATLQNLGYTTITIGKGGKYPNAHVSTCVAAKSTGEPLPSTMPQPPLPACGGGVAGLRLSSGISVIGAHTAFGGSDLWRAQIRAITEAAETEQRKGNEVILAGDWNEIQDKITVQPGWKNLNLKPVDPSKTPTCPVSLPTLFRRQLDHIFVPKTWTVASFKTMAFGSDHLAVLAEVGRIPLQS